MDYGYTRNINKSLDIISEGGLIWYELVRQQYNIFNPISKKLLKDQKQNKCNNDLQSIGNYNGIDFYKFKGKWGWALKYNIDDSDKPKYIKLPDSLIGKLDTLDISDIKHLIPINLGDYQKNNINIKNGEWGYYIEWGKKNYSINNQNITYEDAIKIINVKKTNKSKVLKEIGKYKIINGQYGLFITSGKKNKPVKGNIDVSDITLKYCNALFKYKK